MGFGKTAKSINISLAARLAAFNLEQIKRITSSDDMDFGKLGKKKMAIFAVIPDNDTSMSYLVGMLYTQIIQELYYHADHKFHDRLPIHVRFILDEFANVSLPEEFDKSLAIISVLCPAEAGSVLLCNGRKSPPQPNQAKSWFGL